MSGSAGVYVIRCVPSGEVYIGSSMDVQKRFAGHRLALGRGTHHNRRLQAAWDHYGEDSFEFEVLEAGLAEDALGDAEQSWILRLRARELGRGFNVHAYRSYRPPARARFAYRPGMTFVFAEPVGDGDAVGEVELELDLEETVSPGTLLVWVKTPADKTRLRMLGMLAEQKRSVEELAALLDLRPSTVSWHLARLKEIGLVAMQAEGNTHVYRLNGKGLGRINKLLAAPERVAMLDDVEAQAWERRVLQDFLAGAYAKALPAYRKKRQIILRWLVRQFEYGRQYPEKEVNEIIKRYHPDTAALRREMIGEKLMQREGGVYWRLEPDTPEEQ